MTIEEIIQKLNEAAATEADRAKAVGALQRLALPIYQAVHDTGRVAGEESQAQKVRDAETARTKAEGERDRATQRADEVERKKGGDTDVEKVKADHKAEVERISGEAKTREETLRGQLQTERQARARADLKLLLTGAEHGIDPDYAQLLVDRPETAARFRFGDGDGALSVVKAGTEVALQVAEGVSPLSVLAQELRASTPPKWVNSGVAGGAGTQTGATGSTPASGYDPVAAGKALAEAQKGSANNTALALS